MRRQIRLGAKVRIDAGLYYGREGTVFKKLSEPTADEAITGMCNYQVLVEDDLGNHTIPMDYRRYELKELRRPRR